MLTSPVMVIIIIITKNDKDNIQEVRVGAVDPTSPVILGINDDTCATKSPMEGSMSNDVLAHKLDMLSMELARIELRLGCTDSNLSPILNQPKRPDSICYLYVKVVNEDLKNNIGKTALEEILRCQVLAYNLISPIPSLKVKIDKNDLFKALSANRNMVKVRLWIHRCQQSTMNGSVPSAKLES